MQKIVTHLWYDKEALEAAEFYVSLFDYSSIDSIVTLNNTPSDTPSGSADSIVFTLANKTFMSISAGPTFKLNPSVSLQVICNTLSEVDRLWKQLSKDGSILMPLDAYPFSEKYGWTEDRFGLSWQIMYLPDQLISQKITPVMLFTGEQYGKAEEAIQFYTSIFVNSAIDGLSYYGDDELKQGGKLMYGAFNLEGQNFVAMDSAMAHDFKFSEAISFLVNCDTQEEIDYLWEELSVVPEAEQCGWLKDKYGFSWQISPTIMNDIMNTKDQEQLNRVVQAFLPMKKMNIAELIKAYEG
ncbi:VOC family protein [Carnobacterium pleistocenium]|uniref:VOC family protein n=1 Tax=Carnobacterium pleistocenium TaxID=181073 RepID=UPI0005592140|nr:VOC family protein [Carnobacterium pleistocenium]